MRPSSSRISRTREWLRHAFAVDDAGTVDLSEPDRLLIDRICVGIVRRRLTTPALIALEMHRPFNYVSAQLLHFFEPILATLTDRRQYRSFSRFLEQRGSIDHLIARIGALEEAQTGQRGRGRQDG